MSCIIFSTFVTCKIHTACCCSSPDKKKSLLDVSALEIKEISEERHEKDDIEQEIRRIRGQKNENDLYALPNKKRDQVAEVSIEEDDEEEKGKKEVVEGIEDKDMNKDIPVGWEKHEDNEGPYYWHIKTGTIQREPPVWPKESLKEVISVGGNQYRSSSLEITNSFSSTFSSIYNKRDVTKVKIKNLKSNSLPVVVLNLIFLSGIIKCNLN